VIRAKRESVAAVRAKLAESVFGASRVHPVLL
jgi:hypothetical protein